MRKIFPKAVEELMKKDKKIFCLMGDIGIFSFRNIFKKFEERILNMSTMEQTMIGFGAGLVVRVQWLMSFTMWFQKWQHTLESIYKQLVRFKKKTNCLNTRIELYCLRKRPTTSWKCFNYLISTFSSNSLGRSVICVCRTSFTKPLNQINFD